VVTAHIQTRSFLNNDIHLKCFVSFFLSMKSRKEAIAWLKSNTFTKINNENFYQPLPPAENPLSC